jgi:hypothetical protein
MNFNRQNGALLLLTFLNEASPLTDPEPARAAACPAQSPQIELRALTAADGVRFIEVSGNGFSCSTDIKLKYTVSYETLMPASFFGEEFLFSYSSTERSCPKIDTFGEDVLSTDGAGKFLHRIRVALTGQFGARVGAVDLASGRQTIGSLE